MLEPVLELFLNAVDTAATIVLLLALWEGRSTYGRGFLLRWLSGAPARRHSSVERFLGEVRRGRPPAVRALRNARPEDGSPCSQP